MPKRKRLTAVKLSDVPLETRALAARELARGARTPADAAALFDAAAMPSNKTYFVLLAAAA